MNVAHKSATISYRSFFVLSCTCVLLFQGGAAAHSLLEIEQLFEGEAIPTELVRLTEELEMTAGSNSVRAQVHANQHQTLEQYMHARTERKCTESRTSLSRLDLAIVELQGRHYEEEYVLRKERDDLASFIAKHCAATSLTE
jgi:hypothetical protein